MLSLGVKSKTEQAKSQKHEQDNESHGLEKCLGQIFNDGVLGRVKDPVAIAENDLMKKGKGAIKVYKHHKPHEARKNKRSYRPPQEGTSQAILAAQSSQSCEKKKQANKSCFEDNLKDGPYFFKVLAALTGHSDALKLKGGLGSWVKTVIYHSLVIFPNGFLPKLGWIISGERG